MDSLAGKTLKERDIEIQRPEKRIINIRCMALRDAAFQSIGEAGQASLAVVGPGIAEALVATAVGLLAAIPATIAYNTFGGRIDGILAMLERFSSQLEQDLALMVDGPPRPSSAARGDASVG
jgi:hypothetical protein